MYAYIDAAADDLSPDTNSGDAALLDVRAAAETTAHDSSEIDRTVGEIEESASQASSAEAGEAVDNNRLLLSSSGHTGLSSARTHVRSQAQSLYSSRFGLPPS